VSLITRLFLRAQGAITEEALERRHGDADLRDGERRAGEADLRDGDADRRDGERRDGEADLRDGERRDGEADLRDGERRAGEADLRDGERRAGEAERAVMDATCRALIVGISGTPKRDLFDAPATGDAARLRDPLMDDIDEPMLLTLLLLGDRFLTEDLRGGDMLR
jgi:hypothetical protein